MKLLDTSAIIRSDLNFSEGIYFVTPGVLCEILDENIKLIINSAIRKGLIKIAEPKEDSTREVKNAAAKTGDIKTLSETDIEILAAALEKNLTVVTDDYLKSFQSLSQFKENTLMLPHGITAGSTALMPTVTGSATYRKLSRGNVTG